MRAVQNAGLPTVARSTSVMTIVVYLFTCHVVVHASLAVPDSYGRGESPPVRVWHCETACKRSFFQFGPEKNLVSPNFGRVMTRLTRPVPPGLLLGHDSYACSPASMTVG